MRRPNDLKEGNQRSRFQSVASSITFCNHGFSFFGIYGVGKELLAPTLIKSYLKLMNHYDDQHCLSYLTALS